jgi:NAD(P)-dependent dehydrogenase (short-subunit alcohol dehydrogenase family)
MRNPEELNPTEEPQELRGATSPGNRRLSGKVAIVTGAGTRTGDDAGAGAGGDRGRTASAAAGGGSGAGGPGIGNGRATAILLARHGARVALLDTMQEWVEQTAKMIGQEGGDCIVVRADVADPLACAAAVRVTVERWGRLDILVNNVGIGGPPGTAVEVDPEAWDRAMRVNVTAMMLMAKYTIPEMRKVGGGAIVNIASVAGLQGGHPHLMYPTSKGAVVNMTRAMAAHHGAEGIRVNCIAPGMVYTPMVSTRGMTPEMREARRQRSLLKTEGTAWDIAHGVLFLASDEARWVTGVVLPIDAGATAGLGALRGAVPTAPAPDPG